MILLVVLNILYLTDQINGQIEYLETTQGINYLGKLNTSDDGPCAMWTTAEGNVNYKQNSQFPDGTVAAALNYCRNPQSSGPNQYETRPWCWLASNSKIYGYCTIPLCTNLRVCRNTYLGNTYTGNISRTIKGNPCLSWSSAAALPGASFTSANWPVPGETITQASNYCRNPDVNPLGTWCYISLSPLTWETCMVALSQTTLNCTNGLVPYNFKSLTTNEQYQQTCAAWSSIPITYYNQRSQLPSISSTANTSLVSPLFNPALMPDLTLAEAQNYCRNPDNDTLGAWCYVQNGASYLKMYCKTPCTGVWACLYDRVGTYYQGTVSVTQEGYTCQRWNSQTPNTVNYVASNFPDATIEAASNYCRNPDSNPGGPWCYRASTTGPPNFGYCTLPTCLPPIPPIPPLTTSVKTSTCQSTATGVEYTGTISVTGSGKTCQRWDALSPQLNPYYNRPVLFNTATMAELNNYCRNPNRLLSGPWCYTTTNGTYIESCNVPKCNPPPIQNCRLTLAGTEYSGTVNTTGVGEPCLMWSSISNLVYTDAMFADGYISSAVNYCRNPQRPNWVGTFCNIASTTPGGSVTQSQCVVPICNTAVCRDSSEGYNYVGNQTKSKSGNICLPWANFATIVDVDVLPDATITAASNYCRNPSKMNVYDGPFCFYNDNGTPTPESCNIAYCTPQCAYSPIGTDYAGIISRTNTNLQCSLWTSISNTLYRNPTALNAATLDAASNFCRNPNSDPQGPWCYTSPQVVGYCTIPQCPPTTLTSTTIVVNRQAASATNTSVIATPTTLTSTTTVLSTKPATASNTSEIATTCYTPQNISSYNGYANVTSSGVACLSWASMNFTQAAQSNVPIFNASYLPGGNVVAASNYCRMPTSQAQYMTQPWCYTSPSSTQAAPGFGFCNVTMCKGLGIFDSPAFSVFISVSIAIASFSLTSAALVFLDDTVSDSTTNQLFQNRPLPAEPSNIFESVVPSHYANNLNAAPPGGGIVGEGSQAQTSIGLYGNAVQGVPRIVGYGSAAPNNLSSAPLLQSQNVALTSSGAPSSAMSGASAIPGNTGLVGAKIVGQGSSAIDSFYGEPILQAQQIQQSAAAMPNNAAMSGYSTEAGPKIVAQGSSDTHAQFFQPNNDSSGSKIIGHGSNITGMTNAASSGSADFKIVGEGYDEIYTFNVGKDIPMKVISLAGAEGGSTSGGIKIVGHGTCGGYSGDILGGGAAAFGLSGGGGAVGGSSGADAAVGEFSGISTSGGGYAGASSTSGGTSGAVTGGGYHGGSATGGGYAGGNGTSGGASGAVTGGGYYGGSAAGASAAAGGYSGAVAAGGFSGAEGEGVKIVSKGSGYLSAGNSALGNAQSSGISSNPSNNAGSNISNDGVKVSKKVYYDIDLNDRAGSGQGKKYEVLTTSVEDKSIGVVNIKTEVKESANAGPRTLALGNPLSGVNQQKEDNQSADIYYSILDD